MRPRSQASLQTLFNESLVTEGADGHGVGGLVAAVQVKEGVNPLLKAVQEGVEVGASQDVVEGDLPLLEVHVHPHALELGGQGEERGRGGRDSILASLLHGQSPVAVRGADADAALAVDGGARHAQVPVVLVAHLHLPVAPAAGDGLAGQGDHHRVEAPGRVGQVLPRAKVAQLAAVLGQLQPRVGRVGVKGQVDWGR